MVFLMRPFLPILVILSISAVLGQDQRPRLVLEGRGARAVIDLAGGSIASFQKGETGLNPLQWDSLLQSAANPDENSLKPRSMGHFLCLDRWGPATEAELAHGMGWHGEASRVHWEVPSQPLEKGGWIESELSAALPLAGLSVVRTIRLHNLDALFVVSESVRNDRHLGRIYNIVQHPTIGPPFLDETVLVDCNGTRGFMQESPLPNPEEPEVAWPKALTRAGVEVDMRRFVDDHSPAVVSYIVEDEYGWVTASSPRSNLLIGYLWKANEYPWIDLWRNARDGKPYARGLEFGTTGLHQPGPVLVEKGKIFDRKLFRFIDADEVQTFSYACFLAEIPSDFSGVESLVYDEAKISMRERGSMGRVVEVNAFRIFD